MEDLAPGIRFYPTEEELISFYLNHKLDGKSEGLNRVMDRVIPVLDIYEFSPWQLPQLSGEYCKRDREQWFFFIKRKESEASGGRPNRLTSDGYWKATGCRGFVISSNNKYIGVKRTMVFYTGRAPRGKKTDWKMNEYKAIDGDGEPSSFLTATPPKVREEFCVCRVYNTSKCLRSFDRRPIGVEMIRQARVDVGDEVARTRTTSHHPLMEERVRRRLEGESSSSLENGQQISVLPMDNEPLWDWDQLNDWSYYGCESFQFVNEA